MSEGQEYRRICQRRWACTETMKVKEQFYTLPAIKGLGKQDAIKTITSWLEKLNN